MKILENLMRKTYFLIVLLLITAVAISGCVREASTPVPTGEGGGEDDLDDLLTKVASQTPPTQAIPGGGGQDPIQAQTDAAATAISKQPAVVTATPTLTPQVSPTVMVPTADLAVPSSYTLQKGEFPYCIARRFNIDVEDLLTANGLSKEGLFSEGLKLTIPSDAGPFEGERALRAHPTEYTVVSTDTFYRIACKFGDVWPEAIAAENGMTLNETLTSGTVLQIP